MKITERIYDAITGETTDIEREETPQEIAEREKFLSDALAAAKELETKATEKAALLSKLGITEDEARLLLG
jgi:hypothetical protein